MSKDDLTTKEPNQKIRDIRRELSFKHTTPPTRAAAKETQKKSKQKPLYIDYPARCVADEEAISIT